MKWLRYIYGKEFDFQHSKTFENTLPKCVHIKWHNAYIIDDTEYQKIYANCHLNRVHFIPGARSLTLHLLKCLSFGSEKKKLRQTSATVYQQVSIKYFTSYDSFRRHFV